MRGERWSLAVCAIKLWTVSQWHCFIVSCSTISQVMVAVSPHNYCRCKLNNFHEMNKSKNYFLSREISILTYCSLLALFTDYCWVNERKKGMQRKREGGNSDINQNRSLFFVCMCVCLRNLRTLAIFLCAYIEQNCCLHCYHFSDLSLNLQSIIYLYGHTLFSRNWQMCLKRLFVTPLKILSLTSSWRRVFSKWNWSESVWRK